MDAGAIRGKTGLEDFVADACEALRMRLVRTPADMIIKKDEDVDENGDTGDADDVSFAPGMTHQIYGEQENVFGYRDLRIDLMMTAASLRAWVDHSYTEKVTDDTVKAAAELDGIEADPVVPPLVEVLAEGQLAKNADEFRAAVKADETFKPMGDKVHEFTVKKAEGEDESGPAVSRTFEVYKADVGTSGFKAYHARLQPWILFFIDAASFIDVDDDRWKCYLV